MDPGFKTGVSGELEHRVRLLLTSDMGRSEETSVLDKAHRRDALEGLIRKADRDKVLVDGEAVEEVVQVDSGGHIDRLAKEEQVRWGWTNR